jgi:hypothetical protein
MEVMALNSINGNTITIPSAQVKPFGQILCPPVPCALYFVELQPASCSWTGMPSGFPVHSAVAPLSSDTELPVTRPIGSVASHKFSDMLTKNKIP